MSFRRQVDSKARPIRRIILVVPLLGLLGLGIWGGQWVLSVMAYDELIESVADQWDVDPRLVRAVAWQESRMKTDAVGGVGERGLMQVTEPVGIKWALIHGVTDFEVEDLFDPETNLHVGTWYLARALDQWGDRTDPVPYALAQYNAGRSHALRWAQNDGNDARQFIAAITFPTTQAYVRNVQRMTASRYHPLITHLANAPWLSSRPVQLGTLLLGLGLITWAIASRRHPAGPSK